MADFLRVSHTDLVADGVVLCANHRLARHLRRVHDRERAAVGLARWQPLEALPVAVWLAALADEALLAGAVDAAAAPRRWLTPLEERLLWERVIAASGGDAAGLFDAAGLAATAQEANTLVEVWGVPAAGAESDAENRSFLRWRAAFRRRCGESGWLEPARAPAWHIDQLVAGAGRLPKRVMFAGFDRLTPQETRLAEVLAARGVALLWLVPAAAPGAARIAPLPDRQAECRAAAAWAARRLAASPRARLAIVVPALGAVRDLLTDTLDQALLPAARFPAGAELARPYNFSLGPPLARQPLVATALNLLRLAANPGRIELAGFGELLRGSYWSATQGEADARAVLEARLRESLGPATSLARLARAAREAVPPAPRLAAQLQALRRMLSAAPARQLPVAWAVTCADWLAALGWPGDRPLSSHEYQAGQAFSEAMETLGRLEGLLGAMTAAEAVARLAQICGERVFQPETEGDPRVEVMGPLEAAGLAFDGLWVMGMNDHLWPAAPRPNPLLPAEAQRRQRAPAASAQVEGEFARAIHERLLQSAPEILFSWAQREGERELRPSPLLAGLPVAELPWPAEVAAAPEFGLESALESLADHQAPPLAEGEALSGGAALLQAQALCPAWAYYRYRLGAHALGEPVEGLDSRTRGMLVHRVLEVFWQERDGATLQAMDGSARQTALAAAIDLALGEENSRRDQALPLRLLDLERERLATLVAGWLDLEASRSGAFRVVARERPEEAQVAGLSLKLRVDRVDELEDGRRLILDYKTGTAASIADWLAERPSQVQLPLYAAFAPEGAAVAGIALAKVVPEQPAFVGLAAEAGLLPGVKAAEDWPGLVALWRRRLELLARELSEGWAPVLYGNARDLEYCELRPLLRLPEAKEWFGGEAVDASPRAAGDDW